MARVRGPRRAPILSGVALALGLAVAGPPLPDASADLYRCVRDDGGIVFTDDASVCPGGRKHEPRGLLQTVGGDAAQGPAAPEPRAAEPPIDDMTAARAQWQQKKRGAEETLQQVEERRAKLEEFVTACNRGLAVVSRDETGLKYQVPCERIRDEHRDAEAEAERLREYLASGLERECRQSGCLPGWIR